MTVLGLPVNDILSRAEHKNGPCICKLVNAMQIFGVSLFSFAYGYIMILVCPACPIKSLALHYEYFKCKISSKIILKFYLSISYLGIQRFRADRKSP